MSEGVMMTLVGGVSALFMMFGGALPYIPQYLQIQKERNSEGFSTKVCLVLLTANILRIAFWFGKFYETPLLIQSFVMIATMIGMLDICVRLRPESSPSKHFTDFDLSSFWDWSSFSDYIQALIVMVLGVAGLTYTLLDYSIFVEALGTLSLCTEATLALPQLIKNYNTRSTEGMSVSMVMLWFFGDSVKTLYFLLRETPVQFLMCGALQIIVDILILFQVIGYGSGHRGD